MKRFLFALIQFTWALPQTLAGLVVFLLHKGKPHVFFHGAVITRWKRPGSVSLGPFIFLSERIKPEFEQRIVVHEYGHCIQSLLFGPLYLLAMGLPSFIWGESPALRRKRAEQDLPYFTFFTERFANYLGTKVTGLKAMQGY